LKYLDQLACLSIIAKIITVVGFFLTIYVFCIVKIIKNSFFKKGRLPDQYKVFDKSVSELSKLLVKTDENQDKILQIIIKIHVTINWFNRNLDGEIKSLCKRIIKDTKINNDLDFNKYQLYCFQLREELGQYIKDTEWSYNG